MRQRRISKALLLIDVINRFDFPDAPATLRHALPTAPRIASLKRWAQTKGVPVIYVNDNFGEWRSDMSNLVGSCTRAEAPGRVFVQQVLPDPKDYSILKPMHSAFYQTPLDSLLEHLGAKTVMLAGIATNSCILCTAHDAKMRDFEVVVLRDCCAARSIREHRAALAHLSGMADAKVVMSTTLRKQ